MLGKALYATLQWHLIFCSGKVFIQSNYTLLKKRAGLLQNEIIRIEGQEQNNQRILERFRKSQTTLAEGSCALKDRGTFVQTFVHPGAGELQHKLITL
jgi:hypothetical protein